MQVNRFGCIGWIRFVVAGRHGNTHITITVSLSTNLIEFSCKITAIFLNSISRGIDNRLSVTILRPETVHRISITIRNNRCLINGGSLLASS